MTPEEHKAHNQRVWLQSVCDSLASPRTKGQTALAKRVGWSHSTVWRKLNGKSGITEADVVWVESKLKRKGKYSI